jgi:hypothetical protein
MLLSSPITFGIFTMFFAQGLIILGAQLLFLGITARGFSQLKRFAIESRPRDRFFENFSMEAGIALGILLAGIGLGICAWVGWELLSFISEPGNRGVFNMGLTKIGTVGTTFAILGVQLIFSSFYSGLFSVEVTEETGEDQS